MSCNAVDKGRVLSPKSDNSIDDASRSSVQQAIKQDRPFRTRSDEAMVGLMLTVEAVRRPFYELMAKHGELTQQQYNVLRILRGAGAQGIPTLDIGDRMIERTPGITRLIDRLTAKDLVERHRSETDRRQVICRISTAGKALLKKLDRPVEALNQAAMAGLTKSELGELIRLLNKVRHQATHSQGST
ncbi:MAG: DNA-binding MarR family transcriptional regulator [Hyphomicrobiaceae bacterium]|jgi:DNA-binding MarR family transcriptional regulator